MTVNGSAKEEDLLEKKQKILDEMRDKSKRMTESMKNIAAFLLAMAASFADASGAESDPSMKALECMASLPKQGEEIMALGVD